MSVKLTYLVHGTTTDNEQHLATGWNPGELSELGLQQSMELPNQIADTSFDVVFSSDLKRAVDTAEIAFSDYPLMQDDRLREANYGDMNGGPHSFKDNMGDFIDTPFPNGESYSQVEERIASFVEMLKKDYDGKHVAVVAHQAPQLALDVVVKGMTWPEAIKNDWRPKKAWQPGWIYEI